MPRPFALPDLGEGLTEAEIVKVLVREGDVISEDAPLLEVETDKATVEIPSPFSGRVAGIHVQPGQTVKVGHVLVTFDDASVASSSAGRGGGAPSENLRTTTDSGRGPAAPTHRQPAAAADAQSVPAAPTTAAAGIGRGPASRTVADSRGANVGSAPGSAGALASDARGGAVRVDSAGSGGGAAAVAARVGPVPATPATRRLARELGVDLARVRATGPGGRVTDDDVRAASGGAERRPVAVAEQTAEHVVAKPLKTISVEPALPKFEQWGPVERQPLSHLRRTIAERMTLSATVIPHVTHFDRADVTELDAIIRRNADAARERGIVLTLTSFLMKAAALALREHPTFNASLDAAAGELIVKRYCHLGVAVATERGLIVPVIRDVDQKSLVALQKELAALAQRVREGKATLEDLRGGTFTITNIGALGGSGAIPIINYPEVAILGVARAREEAVVRDGRIVPRTLLPISLTFDHRVADGADGARFATAIVRRLERPEQLLLEW
jgi:pyruvate dehydrogenase E2 component (dihydrolipoyllysine-residue acetyltransferase)